MSEEPQEPEVDELTQVRSLILDSHPDIVPELIAGETIPDLVASIATARAAYARVIAGQPQQLPLPLQIPAGGNTPLVVDTDSLPTGEKIRRGLAAHTRKD